MSKQEKSTLSLVVLIAVIVAAFVFVNPVFRFSCSRVFMHDFLGMQTDMLRHGVFFSDYNIARLIPLSLMFLVWAGISLWAYYDAERRNMNGLLWGLFVFVGNIIGLIIYLIIRSSPSEPAAGIPPAKSESCPGCSKPIYPAYVACPYCGLSLARKCANCGGRVQLDWKVCAHCGNPIHNQKSTE